MVTDRALWVCRMRNLRRWAIAAQKSAALCHAASARMDGNPEYRRAWQKRGRYWSERARSLAARLREDEAVEAAKEKSA
jgi:hypothetical protein